MGLSPDDIFAIAEENTGFRDKQVTLWKATATDCPACISDDLTQNSVYTDCTTCNGYGKTIAYAKQIVMVRPDYDKMEWVQGDSGETRFIVVTMHVAKADQPAFKSVRDTKESFLVLDSYEMKPIMWWPTFVADEFMVVCQGINVETWLRARNNV